MSAARPPDRAEPSRYAAREGSRPLTENACVYSPVPELPWDEVAAELAPDAAFEASAEQITLTWADLRVTIHPMPRAELSEHLAGFRGYIRGRGGEGAEALATRVLSTMAVLGIELDPALADDRAMRVVFGLTSGTDGLCFVGGEVYDGQGQQLLLGGRLARPAAPRVAARALCLLAGAFRGLLDQDAGGPDEADANDLARTLLGFVDGLPAVRDELEPHERALLEAPVGEAPQQAIVNAVWGAEAACVLLWALGVRPLAAHDHSEHPFAICRELGLPGDAPPALLSDPTLRPVAEVDAQHSLLRGINWRMRQFSLTQDAVDFEAFSEKPHVGAFEPGDTPLAITSAGKDLAIQGEPISLAAEDAVRTAASIAVERHRAANWLLGSHPLWSRVDTPT